MLTKNRAFGQTKHRNQVLELFKDIRLALATALFNWSAQRGLPKSVSIKLISFLMVSKSTDDSMGSTDDVTLTLLMALLYSFDTSVLQRSEDLNVIKMIPILHDPEYLQAIHDTLVAENLPGNNYMYSIMQFAFGLSLANMRNGTNSLHNLNTKIIERDEYMIDLAIERKVFRMIFSHMLEKEIIYM